MSSETRGRFFGILILIVAAFQIAFLPIGCAPSDKLDIERMGTFDFRLGKAAFEDESQRDVVMATLLTKLEEAGVPLDPAKFSLTDATTLHVETLALSEDERTVHELQLITTLAEDYPAVQAVDLRREEEGQREPLVILGPVALYSPAPQVQLGLDLRGGQHLVLECRPETVMVFSTEDASKPMVIHEGSGALVYVPGVSPATEPEPATDASEEGDENADEAEAEAPEAGETADEAEEGSEGAEGEAAEGEGETPAEADEESGGEEEAGSWPAPTLTALKMAQQLDALAQRNNVGLRKIEIPSSHQIVVRTEAEDQATASAEYEVMRAYLHAKYGDALQQPDPQSTFIAGDTADKVKEIVDRRLYAYGKVKEPIIQTQGSKRLIVELPGVKDPEEALRIIGKTAVLEFRLVPDKIEPRDVTDYSMWHDTRPGHERDPDIPVESVLHASSVDFTGADLMPNARPDAGNQNDYIVQFELKPAKKEPFHQFTRASVGRIMAIVLDGEVQMAPVIRSAIPGKGIIEGDMTVDEATELALLLNAGALPVRIDIVENRTISATLGASSVRQSAMAGLIGLVCVFLFMVFYYRTAGLLADAALAIYCLLLLAVLVLARTTITLPGIAGIILSIGMAVDANVIIFERLKEELRTNKTLRSAVEAAFARAWTAILDGNITTLIVAGVLYWLGTSIIKSFAVTLACGVGCSLFTAVTVTRWLCQWLVTTKVGQSRGVFGDSDAGAAPEPAATGR